ncbi:MAG: hypothetical protein JNM57_07685 [Cyclobacteriaceae bacterium]|nr:hypothetical protein [Cyclobacteriaceae bacterium]
MKAFLTVTAVFEGATGLILLLVPSVVVSVLLGAALNEPGEVIARLAGVALLTLSIVCWSYRGETQNISGISKSLLFYNIVAGSLLIYTYISGFSGMGLWPAAILHFVLGIWCLQLFRKQLRHDRP